MDFIVISGTLLLSAYDKKKKSTEMWITLKARVYAEKSDVGVKKISIDPRHHKYKSPEVSPGLCLHSEQLLKSCFRFVSYIFANTCLAYQLIPL